MPSPPGIRSEATWHIVKHYLLGSPRASRFSTCSSPLGGSGTHHSKVVSKCQSFTDAPLFFYSFQLPVAPRCPAWIGQISRSVIE